MLSVKNLSVTLHGNKTVLDKVSFSIDMGKTLLLCGKNGSGKSVLLRALKGLIPIDGGSVLIEGKDLSKNSKQRNRDIALVFQDTDTQIVGQTVYKDLMFGLTNIGIKKEESETRIKEEASFLSISHVLHKNPMNLSGGEKRRVALGGVLVMKPRIIFLDEPFANLDYPGILQVIDSIIALQEDGATIVIATHEIEKIAYHCDSLLILDEGKVVSFGSTKETLHRAENYGIHIPRVHDRPLFLEELTWKKK
jgi:biotin transport system ATP-binding protein